MRLFAARFTPDSVRGNAETTRRAHLFISFSLLGVIFGAGFALFYLLIGHDLGAAIVFICTLALLGAPKLVRAMGLEFAGNVYAGVLVAGFAALTAIEGGVHGHAIAWLAAVPLCACLLVNQRACWIWCCICLAVVGFFCGANLFGIQFPVGFPPRWDAVITAAGYLSLAAFMSMVGLSFEIGRRQSLTRLHAALDALSTANERLEELNQERSQFLGIAAHDLRNPLNSILGFAQLMTNYSPGVDELQRDSIARILSAGGRMRELLDRLLSTRAIEDGKLELNIEPCDIGLLTRTAVANHLLAAKAKDIPLLDIPSSAPIIALADRPAVQQILDNLLSNAIKFSPSGKPVSVMATGLPDDLIRIEVKDAGPGLSEDDQKKLYGRFAKLSARPTAGESSTGLGLSIVKRLAGEMGGSLECRSRLGEGATFSLTLKAAPALAVTPLAAAPAAEPALAG